MPDMMQHNNWDLEIRSRLKQQRRTCWCAKFTYREGDEGHNKHRRQVDPQEVAACWDVCQTEPAGGTGQQRGRDGFGINTMCRAAFGCASAAKQHANQYASQQPPPSSVVTCQGWCTDVSGLLL